MYLKIMSDDGLPDEDYRKKYTMIEVVKFEFYRSLSSGAVASIPFVSYTDIIGKESSQAIYANIYVMNNQGKTIDSWSPNI